MNSINNNITNNKIYIRVDMNETIATGHIMRCLSVADAAREQNVDTIFIVADEKPIEMLSKRGYEAIVLHTHWKHMEEELGILIPIIKENNIQKLLVDSYQVTKEYLRRLEEVTEVYYLDDLDAFEYPVSNVICYANYYKILSYGKYTVNTRFYLGTAYMPLRKVFQGCQAKDIREKIERILILSGGSDSFNVIENLANLFKIYTQIDIDIVCGAFYHDFQEVKNKFGDYVHIHFYQNVSNLDEFMEEADIAISAGGTTLYELCAKGTPTISYSFADNQIKNVKQFQDDNLISYAGDVRYDDIYNNIERLYTEYEDKKIRIETSIKMQRLVDGRGGNRIATLLIQ